MGSRDAPRVTAAGLSRLFDSLNAEFFQGRLPRYRVVFNGRMPARGMCLSESRLIRIHRDLAREPRQLRRTLLHEMCHIGSLGHGRRFQAKLWRLARMGEPWAAEQARGYRDGISYNHAMSHVRDRVRDWAIEVARTGRRTSFPAVARAIGNEVGFTRRELVERAPWVRQAWQNDLAWARVAWIDPARRLGRGARPR